MQGWGRYSLPDGPLPLFDADFEVLERLIDGQESEWDDYCLKQIGGAYEALGKSWSINSVSSIWHFDPITESQWPSDRYCFDIPYRHVHDMGDIKYVWEINRLQFLQPVAALARARKSDEYVQFCCEQLESWIDENPPFAGLNWSSGIELALRVVSFISIVTLVGEENVSPRLREKLRATLNAHAVWLSRYPSRFSSANNHLISEAGALFLLGSLMPDLPQAEVYRDYGYATLVAEAEKQILADGVGAEQSPTYTAFTLEWYLLALVVARSQGKAFPDSVLRRLEKAGEFLRWTTDSQGNQPRIGDDDEGRVIRSGPEQDCDYVSAILGNLAAIVQDDEIAPPIAKLHLRDVFLGSPRTNATVLQGWQAFNLGGYSIFRHKLVNREAMLVFDHGPLGYLSIAAHGHADALAVWLHVDGIPVFVDAGTYLYHAGGADRDYFRGTLAHNTLILDDSSQSTISGPFNWARKANAWQIPVSETEGGLCSEAQHDGYKKRFGVVHQRKVGLEVPDGYLITDSLLGTLKHSSMRAKVRYHLAPGIEIAQTSPSQARLIESGAALVAISVALGSAPCAFRVVAGEVSGQFGRKEQTQVIEIECAASQLLSETLVTSVRIVADPASKHGSQSHG
jgi:hypothetical protein